MASYGFFGEENEQEDTSLILCLLCHYCASAHFTMVFLAFTYECIGLVCNLQLQLHVNQ
jgi:hypothetical protein